MVSAPGRHGRRDRKVHGSGDRTVHPFGAQVGWSPLAPPSPATPQVDMLLRRMRADSVRFSPQAVARLANFAFTRGEPAAAYALFKVRLSFVQLAPGAVLGRALPPFEACGSMHCFLRAQQRPAPSPCCATPCSPPPAPQKVRNMGLLSLEAPPSKAASSESDEEGSSAAAAAGADLLGGGSDSEAGSDTDDVAAAVGGASVDGAESGAEEEEEEERRRERQRMAERGQAAYSYCRMIAACHKAR